MVMQRRGKKGNNVGRRRGKKRCCDGEGTVSATSWQEGIDRVVRPERSDRLLPALDPETDAM